MGKIHRARRGNGHKGGERENFGCEMAGHKDRGET